MRTAIALICGFVLIGFGCYAVILENNYGVWLALFGAILVYDQCQDRDWDCDPTEDFEESSPDRKES